MAGIGDIAVGPNEKIYIADILNQRVQIFEENSITCESDFDCDGDIDGADAGLLKEDFGRNLLFFIPVMKLIYVMVISTVIRT